MIDDLVSSVSKGKVGTWLRALEDTPLEAGEAVGGLPLPPELGPLVPIREGTKGHAHLKGWQKVSSKVLQKVMAEHPGCNVGLRLDNYLALDPDSEDAAAFLEKLERRGKLPATVAWRSASGRVTRLYLPPAGVSVKPISPTGNVFSLELRTSKRKQCLIPPSYAESKQNPGELKRYEWVNDPWSTPVAVLPPETLKTIQELPKPKIKKGKGKSKTGKPGKSAQVKKGRSPVAPDSIPEGQRNDFLFRHGCSMRGRGATRNEIEAELQELNQARCAPPLEVGEVSRIAQNAAQCSINSSNPDVWLTYDDVIDALEELGGRERWVKRADLIKKIQRMEILANAMGLISVPTIDRVLKRMRGKRKRLVSHKGRGWYKLPKAKGQSPAQKQISLEAPVVTGDS